jgi:hypothetical protein
VQPSHLGSGGPPNKNIFEIFAGRIMKQVVGIPSGLQGMVDWSLWRGQSPLKWEKKLHTE